MPNNTCSTWKQSQKWQNDLCSFPRQAIQYHGNPSVCQTSNTEEGEVELFFEDLQDILELTPRKKRCLFHYRGLECKSRKSRNTWSNRKIWPWRTELRRAKANRVLPREHIGHSIHSLPITQEKTLYIDITRWSMLKPDCNILCSQDGETLYSQQKQDR